MEDFDPRAIMYKKAGRDRRKADDPSHKGPERRLGRRRKKVLDNIIRFLEKEAKGK